MKTRLLKAVLICSAFLCGSLLFGQAGDYAFSVSSGTYTPLGSSATAVTGIIGDTQSDDVPIGFDFDFEGVTYDTVSAASDGFLSFVKGASSYFSNNLNTGASSRRPLVAPLWDDHAGSTSSSSEAFYEVSGSAPNRVFTFEWRYWEWRYNATDSVVSFQVKLYETTNVIEFTYNWECPACINSPSASIGLSGGSTFLSVTGVGTGSPTTSNTTEDSSIDTLVTGQVFTFTPPACASPGSIAYSNIKTDSITINWTAAGSGPWYIYWGPCGFNQASAAVSLDTATTTTFYADALSSGTNYEFRIFEDCGSNGFSDTVSGGCVSTLCLTQSLPYTEYFSSNLGCMTVTQNGGSTQDTWMWVQDYNGTQTVDGNPGFAFVNSDAAGSGTSLDEIMETPEIDASSLTGALVLEFDQYYRALGDTAAVDVWDGTQWVNVLKQSSTIGSFGSPDFQSINLSNYANANLKVRFHYYDANWAYYWAVDNIEIKEVQCQPSTMLSAYAIGSDSIAINWIGGGSAVNYGVEFGPAGFSPGGGQFISTTDTFTTIKPLSNNSAYDVYVYDTCSAGSSVAAGPITVTTLCLNKVAPYMEDFDGSTWVTGTGFGTNDTIDPCWSRNSETGYKWSVFNATTGSSSTGPDVDHTSGTGNFLYTEASSTTPSVAELLSPMIDVSVLTKPYVSFWYHRYGSATNMGDMTVEINDGSGWDTLVVQTGTEQSSGSDPFTQIGFEVTSYGDTIQIRFRGFAKSCCAGDMAIDDFEVDEAPSCLPILNLTAGNIRDTAATLRWDSTTTANSYQVWFGPQGFYQGTQTTGGTRVITMNDSLRVDTLADLTCYEFVVRGICGPGDSTTWYGPYSFCTPATCPAPTALGVDPSTITLTAADIYFTSGGSSNFNIEYGTAGFSRGAGTSLQATNDTVPLTGLMSGTEYEFYVRDSCSAVDTSVWTGPYSFITAFSTNYLQDFTQASPLGWSEAEGVLSSNTTFVGTTGGWGSGNYGNTGSNGAYKVNLWDTDINDWLISPSIYLDPNISNLQVEFDALITEWLGTARDSLEGVDDTIALVVSTDNGASWSVSDTIFVFTEDDTLNVGGEHFIVPLTGYTGYVKFGFYGTTASGGSNGFSGIDFFVDNFEVRTPRACAFPSNLRISEVTTDSALVTWTPGTASFINAEVIYTLGNQPASQGTIVNSTNDSLYLTGLSSATGYCVYLVEECSSGFSDTIGPVCFTTQCLKQSLPYTEDFTLGMGCFTAGDSIADGLTWMWMSNYGTNDNIDGSPGFIMVDSDDAGSSVTMNEYAYSPEIDASGLAMTDSLFVEFDQYFRVYTSGLVEKIEVDVYDGSSWVTAYAEDQSTGTLGAWGTPDHVKLNITQYANADLRIRLHYYDANWEYWWAVDNFEVYAQNFNCPAPTNLAVANESCDSVEVSWTSGSTATSSYIEYGPVGFSPNGGTIVNNVTSPYTLSGLMLDTEYDIYVVDSCSMDGSTPAGPVMFKTDSVGPVLASFTYNQVDTNYADANVNFDASASTGDGLTYSWDFDNGTGSGMNASSVYSANGSYNVILTVTDRCGNTDDTTITITVGGISIVENAYEAGIDVYPNPSSGQFLFEVKAEGVTYTAEITDLSGKVIYRKDQLRSGNRYDVNLDVASGVYIIRFSGQGLNASQRILID